MKTSLSEEAHYHPDYGYDHDEDIHSSSFSRENYKRDDTGTPDSNDRMKILSSLADDEWSDYDYSLEDDSVNGQHLQANGMDNEGTVRQDYRESTHTDYTGHEQLKLSSVGSDGSVQTTQASPSEEHKPATNEVADQSVESFRGQFKPKPKPPKKSQNKSRVTTEQILDLKQSLPLSAVIETYNLPNFSRTPQGARANCPFHDDTNPSLSINDDKGLYKCFACGAGGDIYNFVREYDHLNRGGEEKMGYMKAVEFVAQEFGDGSLDQVSFVSRSSSSYSGVDISIEQMPSYNERKQRILQANAAAVAFYTKCLVTLPTAGRARSYLKERKITASTIRNFCLGYAPDVYYGDENSGSWGAGSLVSHLEQEGFTADEIMFSGLATQTKKMRDKVLDGSKDVVSPEDLMDRFRGRLIVPIMDSSGRNVIALGGRHLERQQLDDADEPGGKNDKFTPAKYINSPESLVFTKKNVLFNMYQAKVELPTKESTSNLDENRTLNFDEKLSGTLVVEGYFDAISLSNIGVTNVVASLGTALQLEQLEQIANADSMAGGGRIALCLDSDEAGLSALERACAALQRSNIDANQLFVATLPEGIKDPAEFVESIADGEDAKARFNNEVLDNVVAWDQWFIKRIISRHQVDAGDNEQGISAACDEIATFLAGTFTRPKDRTERAKIAAGILAEKTIHNEDEMNSSSVGMIRVQLEADILNIASRKASVREAVDRRIESADGIVGEMAASKLTRLAFGGGTTEDEEGKLSKSALIRSKPPRTDNTPSTSLAQFGSRSLEQEEAHYKQVSGPPPSSPPQKKREAKARESDKPEHDLTPHFKGFDFVHKSDRDWMGLSGSKRAMYLGETHPPVEDKDRLRAETPVFEPHRPRRKRSDAVFFNSNQYLGHQYLSSDAMLAGYSLGDGDKPGRGESIVEFTARKLFDRDADSMIMQAETRLLKALVQFPQARGAMRTVYSTSTFGPTRLRWTSEEREWLFLCLSGSDEALPRVPERILQNGSLSALREHLISRADCPKGAFDANFDFAEPKDTNILIANDDHPDIELHEHEKVDLESLNVDASVFENETEPPDPFAQSAGDSLDLGLLDGFFQVDTDMFPSFSNSVIAHETRAELTVQETVATLLHATAMKRFALAKSKLQSIVEEMDLRLMNEETLSSDLSAISSEELEEQWLNVGNEVVEAQMSLYESQRSCDRINSHLLDYSVSNGVQFKQSQAELDRLDQMMEEHIESLPEDTHRPNARGDDGDYTFGSDEYDPDIDARFGGRDPNEYVIKGLPDGESKFD